MKTKHLLLLTTLTLATSLIGINTATAEGTNTPPPPPAEGGKHHPKLPPELKEKLEKAREQVFAANPELKTEREALEKERADLKASGTATPEAKKALFEKVKAHEQKMHAALIKADPTLEPALNKMKERREERKEKRGDKKPGEPAPAEQTK